MSTSFLLILDTQGNQWQVAPAAAAQQQPLLLDTTTTIKLPSARKRLLVEPPPPDHPAVEKVSLEQLQQAIFLPPPIVTSSPEDQQHQQQAPPPLKKYRKKTTEQPQPPSTAADATTTQQQQQQPVTTTTTKKKPPQKKPRSQQHSSSAAAAAIYPIFTAAAELTTDAFWKDIFLKMSRGVYKKGFRFHHLSSPVGPPSGATSATTTRCGYLTFRRQNREFRIDVPSDPHVVMRMVSDFIRKHTGINSDGDQLKFLTAAQRQQQTTVMMATSWNDIKGSCMRRNLISDFAERFCHSQNLPYVPYLNILSQLLSLGIQSGRISPQNIVLNPTNETIDRVIGLKFDEFFGDFYCDIERLFTPASLKQLRRRPPTAPGGGPVAVPPVKPDTFVSTLSLIRRTLRRQLLHDDDDGANDEDDDAVTVATTTATTTTTAATTKGGSGGGISVFTSILSAVERYLLERSFESRLTTTSTAVVTTQFYKSQYKQLFFAPIAAAAQGYHHAITTAAATTPPDQRISHGIEVAIDHVDQNGTTALYQNVSPSVPGIQQVFDAVIFQSPKILYQSLNIPSAAPTSVTAAVVANISEFCQPEVLETRRVETIIRTVCTKIVNSHVSTIKSKMMTLFGGGEADDDGDDGDDDATTSDDDDGVSSRSCGGAVAVGVNQKSSILLKKWTTTQGWFKSQRVNYDLEVLKTIFLPS